MRSTRVADRYRRLRTHFRSPAVAAHYDANLFRNERFRTVNEQQLAALERLLEHTAAAGHPVRRVLDLACGTGRLFPALLKDDRRVVGCDLSLAMLTEADRKVRLQTGDRATAGLVVGDGERLPFADGSFDAVVSCRFMRHVPALQRILLLREMARVSRRWVIVDPRFALHPLYARDYLRGLLSIPWRLPNYGFTRPGLERELRDGGLSLERIEPLHPGSGSFLALARRCD